MTKLPAMRQTTSNLNFPIDKKIIRTFGNSITLEIFARMRYMSAQIVDKNKDSQKMI